MTLKEMKTLTTSIEFHEKALTYIVDCRHLEVPHYDESRALILAKIKELKISLIEETFNTLGV